MVFANSLLLLLGGLLVGVPIVLHLLMQPKPKLAVFPAMKFLQAKQLSTQRSLRLRHWILLALRALLILLLALALAGPAVAQADFGEWIGVVGFGILALLAGVLFAITTLGKRSRLLSVLLLLIAVSCFATSGWMAYRATTSAAGSAITNRADPVAALIVFDNSPRMTYVRANQSNFERGQEMTKWVLSQLPPGSRIAVADTQDDDPFFSVDTAAAQNRIQSLTINYRPLDLPTVLARGFVFLKDAQEDRHEIYVITDLTKPSWVASESLGLAETVEQAVGNTAVFVIDVGEERPKNLTINSFELDSERFTTSNRLVVQANLFSSLPDTTRTVVLEVEKPDPLLPVVQNGKTVLPTDFWQHSEVVEVPTEKNISISMQLGQDLPLGVHHGRISVLGSDGLALDDQRYFTVEVSKRWQVLVVAPSSVNSVNLTALLAPANLVEAGAAPFDVSVIEPDELSQYELRTFQSVYLLDPAPLAKDNWNQLERFVFEGGGLGIFLGSNAASKSHIDQSFLEAVPQKLLGGQLQDVWQRIDGSVSLSPEDMSHPIFKLLRSNESGLAWFQFPVYFHWGFEVATDPDANSQVLLRYNNRQPAIVERNFGAGRVLTMTTPITERSLSATVKGRPFGERRDPWNQLFSGTPFPTWALLRQLAAYLAQLNGDTLNMELGQYARLKNDPRSFPESYALFSPELTQAPTRASAHENYLTYKFTDLPGQYRLKGSRDDKPVLRGFSVNLPPNATNLERIDASGLDKALGKDRYQIARDQVEIERQQGTSRQGQEFYPLIMLMICIVFGMEFLLSNRFYEPSSRKSRLAQIK